MGQYPNLPRTCLGLKKNLIPVPNLFIKFKPRPIRGGAGRVPEKNPPHLLKTIPISVPLSFNVIPMDNMINPSDKL